MFSIFTEVMKNVLPKTHAHMERQGVLVDMYVGVSSFFFLYSSSSSLCASFQSCGLFFFHVFFFMFFLYFENLEGREQM